MICRLLLILFLFLLVGCSSSPRFSIGVVNGTKGDLIDATLEFENGSAPAGWFTPGQAGVADAPRPRGPITFEWSETNGIRYAVMVPATPEYVGETVGILVLTVLPDHSVSVHPARQEDCWAPEFYRLGAIYPSQVTK